MTARPAARLLDITRLVSRIGRGSLTGIDRVERAYLTRLSAESEPLFLLLRTRWGYLLLPGQVGRDLCDWLDDPRLIGARVPRLLRGWISVRAMTVTALRRRAVGRCLPARLDRLVVRHLPNGGTYFNVGHANLSEQTLTGLRRAGDMEVCVMIHDTIPLDHPDLSRDGAPQRFEAGLRSAMSHAARLIVSSQAVEQDVRRWCARFGATPETLVAPLGVTSPLPGAIGSTVSVFPDLDPDRPYFLCLGTIEPRKQHGFLLDVWTHLIDSVPPPDVPQLVIVGRRGWKNAETFRRLDSAPFMRRHVHECGDLPDDQVAGLMGGARALLMPSLAEGFGLPVAEAALAGKPVVCPPLPVYREILGDYPVYANNHDLYSWAGIIMDMAARPGAKPIGAKADHDMAAIPTWADHFNLVLNKT